MFRESYFFIGVEIVKRKGGTVWGFTPLRSPYVHENKVSTLRRLRLGVVGLAVNYSGVPSEAVLGVRTVLFVPSLGLRILL